MTVDPQPLEVPAPSSPTTVVDGDPAFVTKTYDDHFYFSLLTFEVEGVLFNVPRRPFETESEVFKDMFALPNASADGSSDDCPLILHGITANRFRAFLRVLFDPAHGTQSDLDAEEWISVLHLAHMWNCSRLFALAISKIDGFDVDPVVKVTLSRAYNITDWLHPAYFKLVTRSQPLTMEEVNELGVECAMKLGELRESRYRWIIDELEAGRTPSAVSHSPYNSFHHKKGKKALPMRSRSPVNVSSITKDLDGDVRSAIKRTSAHLVMAPRAAGMLHQPQNPPLRE